VTLHLDRGGKEGKRKQAFFRGSGERGKGIGNKSEPTGTRREPLGVLKKRRNKECRGEYSKEILEKKVTCSKTLKIGKGSVARKQTGGGRGEKGFPKLKRFARMIENTFFEYKA